MHVPRAYLSTLPYVIYLSAAVFLRTLFAAPPRAHTSRTRTTCSMSEASFCRPPPRPPIMSACVLNLCTRVGGEHCAYNIITPRARSGPARMRTFRHAYYPGPNVTSYRVRGPHDGDGDGLREHRTVAPRRV